MNQHSHFAFRGLLALLFGLILFYQPQSAAAAAITADPAADTTAGTAALRAPHYQFLQFYPHVDNQTRQALIADLGATELYWLPQIQVAVIQMAPQSGLSLDPAEVTQRYIGVLKYAESDLAITGSDLQVAPASQGVDIDYGLEAIHAQTAWSITQGRPETIVAVLDSGVTASHPELSSRLVAGFDFVDDDPDPNDESGHGTHIAGIIAAANDGQGMTGVCPACSLMPIRVLNDQNLGTWSTVVRGILYAVDNNASVINLSLGATSPSRSLEAAIDYARDQDVLIVAAAGNADSPTLFFPAAIDGVIAVGAIGPDNQRWQHSNSGSFLDVVAPGQLIYSTYHESDNRFYGYTYMSGTSMATPYVSGLLALLKSAYPDQTAGELIQLLVAGVDDLGEPGWDTSFGFGRINAAQTMHLPIASASRPTQRLDDAVHDSHIFIPWIARDLTTISIADID